VSASPESAKPAADAQREAGSASASETNPDSKPAEANGGKPRAALPAATEGASARSEGGGKGGGNANGHGNANGNGNGNGKTSAASGSGRSNADSLLERRAPRTQAAQRSRTAKNGHAKPVAQREPPAEAEPEPEPEPEKHWSYHGAGGPEHWAKLNPDFAACAQGKRQSPIDIKDGARLELEPIRFDYKPVPLRIVDSGHTVQVNYAEGSHITVAGERYELKQFHFHKPSEERVDGRWFDMVAHLVHRSADARLAVVAVLFEARQQPNAFLRALWPHLPLEAGREFAPAEVTIDATALLPETRTYFTYIGSLTTPPCTEGVLWIVLKTPLEVSPEQVAVFGKLYSANARPVQPANGRLIKESM
jgi:carbonic anhydrase